MASSIFLSYDSNFYAVDGATGTLKWKFKTASERRFAVHCARTHDRLFAEKLSAIAAYAPRHSDAYLQAACGAASFRVTAEQRRLAGI
jgi:PQQ enzyme-like repeat protein